MECPDCSYSVSFGPAQGNDCGCSTPYLLQEDEVARAAEMIRTEPEVTGRVGLCLGQGAMLAGVVLFFSLFVFLAGGVVGIVDDVISDGETLSEAAAWYASESVGWWIGTGVVALVGLGGAWLLHRRPRTDGGRGGDSSASRSNSPRAARADALPTHLPKACARRLRRMDGKNTRAHLVRQLDAGSRLSGRGREFGRPP